MVLLTGASGYVGGRLLLELEKRGERIRCLARRPELLAPRVGSSTEVVGGDVSDPSSLRSAMAGVHTAFYLVHAMDAHGDFARRDREAAACFGSAAREAAVRRIVYLGGLGRGADLSEHLASRQEVGRVLAESGVPIIELRASVIIGSGSLSFEMVRALVERLPVMVTPRWVSTRTQPIAVEDVIAYLVAALESAEAEAGVFEIGGADVVSYQEIMREYARQRGLRRWLIPVPVLTPRLSSRWLRLITPLHAAVGRALIDGVRNETVVADDRAVRTLDVRPIGFSEAIARALRNEDRAFAETRWCDAIGDRPSEATGRLGTRIVDSRSIEIPRSPEEAFAPIRRIGGRTGWYHGDALWRIRGTLDLLVGGPGLRRGRRDPDALRRGDALDFWRVEAFEPPHLLRLVAEMRLPGRAWLQFEVEPTATGARIRQTAIFDPRGLFGLLYWYALFPLHRVIFTGMLRAIAAAALRGPSSVKFPEPPVSNGARL
ncbi:MAG: SDR family oxidoreductase [Candidatus Eisenbacteria bacterium]|uniref:SDR family oxidoreductase n=1 Tax=Eiseniibacteriota bacterium TaxID=2212470 RepID=A0A849SBE3_UNCEI|nr:SDR family oxidoreductase [Candidatus Eisenbacteria bacterium]